MLIMSFLLLLLMSPPALAVRHSQYPDASVREAFVRAMNEATQRVEETKRQTSLMNRLLQSAKPVKTAFVKPNNDNNDNDKNRNLGSYYDNYGYKYNYGYYSYQNGDWQNYEDEAEEDGDDVFADYGGLNLTNYALKYMGCQNIHTFSDEMAADNDASSPLAMNRFVVFRLCPKDTCSNYNARGCDYNYGEYMIPMEDYLATMEFYHIQQYQTYCQTCALCMSGRAYQMEYVEEEGQQNRERDLENSNSNNYNYNGGGGGQYYYYNKNSRYYRKNYGGEDYNYAKNNYYQNNGNNNNYKNGDDYYGATDDLQNNNDDVANPNHEYYADAYNNYNAYPNDDMFKSGNGTDDYASTYCMYKDVCEAYKQACGNDRFTDDNYEDISAMYAQYFECSEFDVGGTVSYLGPHCRSDGFTIGIGIYEDEYCSSYVGDVVDIQKVTGQSFDDQYLSPYYPKQCISCTASESYDLMTEDQVEEENGGIYEVCGYLYQQAAKCNRYLAERETYQGAYQQEANEEDVCNFVASLIENNYDEYGEAVLESPEWELSRWKEINAYRQDIVRATKEQIIAILASVGLVVLLSLYITYLRYKLSRRVPWFRGFGKSEEAEYAGHIARASSGITMQRSMSNLEPGYSGSGSLA